MLSTEQSLACLSTGGRRRLLDHGCGSADHERLLGDRDVRRVLGQEPQEHFRDVLLCSEGRLASFGPALELPRERCENRHFKKSPHVKKSLFEVLLCSSQSAARVGT